MVLATDDPALTDAVESVGAAFGLPVARETTAAGALAAWRTAGVLLVGADLAAALASEAPKRRPRVYLVGFDVGDLAAWSVPLGAEVIGLPHGVAWLSAVVGVDADASCPVVAVVGGSGGAGASTLAAGLALAASRAGVGSALVDADPLGGGIDLLLGAERTPGYRWPRLAGASGEVGDVRDLLPAVAGVSVVSMARDGSAAPGPEAVQAVAGSLCRHHGLVVLDCGRSPWAAARALVRGARPALVVTGGGVRAVAATAEAVRALDLAEAKVVVRATPGVRVPPELVAETLELELWGVLPHDPGLAASGEAGELPRGRAAWTRAVAALTERVLAEASDGD